MKKIGRPTKYRRWMCERAVELMRGGASLNEVAADLGVWKENMTDWEKVHEEFHLALQHGRCLAEAWWEKKGREDLNAERFHSATYGLTMANRFGWRSKVESTVNASVGVAALSTDEIRQILEELRAIEPQPACSGRQAAISLQETGVGAADGVGASEARNLLAPPEAD